MRVFAATLTILLWSNLPFCLGSANNALFLHEENNILRVVLTVVDRMIRSASRLVQERPYLEEFLVIGDPLDYSNSIQIDFDDISKRISVLVQPEIGEVLVDDDEIIDAIISKVGSSYDTSMYCLRPSIYIDDNRSIPKRTMYKKHTFQAADVASVIRHDNNPLLPVNLQGIFFQNDVGKTRRRQPSILSFATTTTTSEVGGGLWNSDQKNAEFQIITRIGGDRQWAQQQQQQLVGSRQPNDADGLLFEMMNMIDWTYKWKVIGGSSPTTNPTKFRIVPDFAIPGTCLRIELNDEECFEPFFHMEMELIEPAIFPDFAAIWRRTTTILGETYSYEVFQLVDGSGNPTNVINDWVAEMTTTTPNSGEFVYQKLLYPSTLSAECSIEHDPML